MLDSTTPRFYAVSKSGAGKGFTPTDAVKSYMEGQFEAFERGMSFTSDLDTFVAHYEHGAGRPTLWVAPPNTKTCAVKGETPIWHLSDGTKVEAKYEQQIIEEHA